MDKRQPLFSFTCIALSNSALPPICILNSTTKTSATATALVANQKHPLGRCPWTLLLLYSSLAKRQFSKEPFPGALTFSVPIKCGHLAVP